ncbi:hypothetical protein [Chryseobacterium gambrini]|uniref:hypothetical protein n=1 Tax=Chryseobacterium gambrini TaxID=373672 RepID=UPI0022F3D6F2|nr:hypothetical protein [Chryseobacterium gambrini]WBX99734.1 hypothetical protein PE065_10870 [Chryseobacterium gambrini]
MSKFLSEKKKLLEDVYEQASKEATETSFNGILLHLERVLQDKYEGLSYKTFENYYKAIVEKGEDYNIKRSTLDNLSKYLGYDDFSKYCSEWKTIEYTIQQAVSKIVITIINKPIFTIPDIIKKNGLGILEMTFVLLMVTGGVAFSGSGVRDWGIISKPLPPAVDKPYMYWDRDRYMATDSSYLGPQIEVIPMEKKLFIYFKRITRPDTLNEKNSMGRVWYDKSNNHVEFFTSFGRHPENEKALKDVSKGILETYAGENAILEK